jgi:Ca2+/H+ antiporter
VAKSLEWPPLVQFTISYLPIIPLASLVDFVVEELSQPLGQLIGGLTNSILGNTVDVVVRFDFHYLIRRIGMKANLFTGQSRRNELW